jgi:hypothetical protein
LDRFVVIPVARVFPLFGRSLFNRSLDNVDPC